MERIRVRSMYFMNRNQKAILAKEKYKIIILFCQPELLCIFPAKLIFSSCFAEYNVGQ